MTENNQASGMHEEGDGLPGRILRSEREARNLGVREVASELHVDSRMIEALERDDFDAIGAPIFVKGHLRNYAKILGIEAQPLVEGYERNVAITTPALMTHKGDGTPMEQAQAGPWFRIFGWFLLLVLLLGSMGWWYYQQDAAPLIGQGSSIRVMGDDADRQPETVSRGITNPVGNTGDTEQDAVEEDTGPAVDDPRASLLPPESGDGDDDARVDESAATDGEAGVGTSQPGRVAPAQSGGGTATVDTTRDATTQSTGSSQPAATTETPTTREPAGNVAAAQEPEAAAATGEPDEIRVLLRFRDASWVEIYNADNQPLVYDLVAAGDTRRVSASSELRVFLGNAPAVSIEVDGQPFDLARFIRRDSTARFRIDPAAQ